MAESWNFGPLECKACKANLRQINPIYMLKSKTDVGFCSRACRSTVTGEDPGVLVPAKAAQFTPAEGSPIKSPPPTPRPAVAKAPVAPKPPAAPKAPKAPAAPKEGKFSLPPTGIIKKFPGVKNINPDGIRGKIFALAKDGMTVAAHESACNKAGLPSYKANMVVLVDHYGSIQIGGK